MEHPIIIWAIPLVKYLPVSPIQRLPSSEEQPSLQQDTSIAEEREGEGEGEGGKDSPSSEGGVEATDGDTRDNMSSQEQRKQKYKDVSNWTKSLDRPTPLSPPRNRQSPEGASAEVNNSLTTGEGTLSNGTQPTSSLTVRETGERSVSPSSSDTVIVTGKPPLPPSAVEGRREERGQHNEGLAAPQPPDETDSGARRYIAQMRARGHKRASSAPTPYQPPPAPSIPPIPHIVVHNSEESRETATRRVKVWL